MDSSKIAIVYHSAVQNAEISIIVYRATCMPRLAHILSADAVELVFSGHPMGHDQLVHSPYDTIGWLSYRGGLLIQVCDVTAMYISLCQGFMSVDKLSLRSGPSFREVGRLRN